MSLNRFELGQEWVGGVVGPCDYCVSPSPFDLDFGTLDFETSVSGLTIIYLRHEITRFSEMCLLAMAPTLAMTASMDLLGSSLFYCSHLSLGLKAVSMSYL